MPDQSSASTEHALMQDITAPLATLPDDPVPVVASVEFPLVLRGYERDAVDAYVQKTSQLVAELQATRSPDAAIRRALERVGEEVSGILQRAHDTAAQITTQSRSEAEDRLETARQEAAQIVARAEERVRELDAETDRIWAERHRIVEDTRELARELLTVTDSAADRFPADAVDTDTAEAVPLAPFAAGVEGVEGMPVAPGIEGPPGVEGAPGVEGTPLAPGVEGALLAPGVEDDAVVPEVFSEAGGDDDTTETVRMPVVQPPEDDVEAQ